METNPQKRNKKPFKELIIKGLYKDWKSFYEPNKEEIYKSIIEIFEEFKNTKKIISIKNVSQIQRCRLEY